MLTELAARCEKATGPGRELDFLIWAALNGVTEITYPTEGHPMTPGAGGRVEGRDKDGDWRLFCYTDPGRKLRNWTPYGAEDRYPPVTALLDAAMTLVSEGYQWAVGSWGNPDTDGPWAWCATEQQSWEMDLDYAAAATPALALCAAALRARAGASHEGR